jgi:hypothetical protein
VRVSTIVRCFRKTLVQILWGGVCEVSTLLISPVEGSLFKSSLLSEVLLDCAENTAKYLRKLYIISYVCDAILTYGGQKRPEYRLKKNKFTLSFSETSRPSIIVDCRTLFMLLTKAKFTHLFQKRVPYETQRSYIVRVLKSYELHAIFYIQGVSKKTQPRNFLRNHFAILKHKRF